MVEDPGLFEIMYSCRAMRRIEPDPVDRDLVVRLIDAANQGPSASNRQHDRWLVLTDPEPRLAMAELNRAAIDAAYPPFPADAEPTAFQWQYENLEHIPVHIVACLKLDVRNDSFMGGVAAGGSIWPKVQNLLLTARALGLAACPTTLPLADRQGARAALEIPETVEPFCLIPVGLADGSVRPGHPSPDRTHPALESLPTADLTGSGPAQRAS